MSTTVDYFFSLVSPWTYLGHARFEALAEQNNLDVKYHPANLGKVFPVSGGLPVGKRAPQRQAYRFMELKRWREHLGVPLNLEPKFFPVPDGLAACVLMAAMKDGARPGPLMGACLRAVWAEERDISDPATLGEILRENSYDQGLVEAAGTAEIQAAYEASTQSAIDRGVFGAPSWIIAEELFWGQDRLEFVQRAVERAAE